MRRARRHMTGRPAGRGAAVLALIAEQCSGFSRIFRRVLLTRRALCTYPSFPVSLLRGGTSRDGSKTKRRRESPSPPTPAPETKRSGPVMADLRAQVEEQIRSTHVLIYTWSPCDLCTKVGGGEGRGVVAARREAPPEPPRASYGRL